MGSSPKKLFTVMSDPVAAGVNSLAPTNDLVKILTPGQATARRQLAGDKQSSNFVDPGAFFSKTQQQKDNIAAADAYAADAPNRAALAATTSANTALRAKNLRRRASGLLSTGADSGSALLSSVTAYGKQSLGG